MTSSVAELAALNLDRRSPAVLLTVVRSPRKSTLRVGQKSLLGGDGELSESLGGGDLERAIVADAKAALETREHGLRYYGDDGSSRRRRSREAIGVYFEPLVPQDHLVIVGAGHVGVAVSSIASRVGFQITVIDDRSDYANRERFPEADRVIVGDIEAGLREVEIDDSTYVVLVTRAHAFDERALRQLLDSDASYMGMIGSKRRVLVVYERLISEGFGPSSLSRIYAPIGLDFGSVTAEEIGLAIVSEMINVKRGGHARSLRLNEWERYVKAPQGELAET